MRNKPLLQLYNWKKARRGRGILQPKKFILSRLLTQVLVLASSCTCDEFKVPRSLLARMSKSILEQSIGSKFQSIGRANGAIPTVHMSQNF